MAESPAVHIPFETADELGRWLAENHTRERELWVRLYRVATGRPSVRWEDCVEQALRFGWIDGRGQSLDAEAHLQRLSPRKAKSTWSARNRTIALGLIEAGRMEPAGLAEVEAARADGRWERAYAGSAGMAMPADFLEALSARPEAERFHGTLDRRNLYAIYHRLSTAGSEAARVKRMLAILDRLHRGERFH